MGGPLGARVAGELHGGTCYSPMKADLRGSIGLLIKIQGPRRKDSVSKNVASRITTRVCSEEGLIVRKQCVSAAGRP